MAISGMSHRQRFTMPRPSLPAPAGNPFLDSLTGGLRKNANGLIGLGSGLLSNPRFSDAMAQGGAGFMQGHALDAEKQERIQSAKQAEDNKNKTIQAMLEAGRPDLANMAEAGQMDLAWKGYLEHTQGIKPNEYDARYEAGQKYGLSGGDLESFALTGSVPGTRNSNVTYGTTPVWGTDSTTGKSGYGVTGSDGSFKLVDTGTFQPMGPGDVAGARAAGTLTGKTETQGAIDLPGAIAKGEYAVDQLKGLLSTVQDPNTGQMMPNQGFEEQFGTLGPLPVGQMTGAIPNTPKAGFQARLNQVQGQAFLQAFESLKGGGAISEVEGLKAQQAIIRAQTTQTREDFEAAINEAIGIYEAGIQRAKDLVTMGVQGRATQSLGGGRGVDDILTELGI